MKQVKNSWVLPTVIALCMVELLVDSQTPLGTVDFIFYFVPVALTVLQQRSSLPIFTACLTSALVVVGFFLSPDGMSEYISGVNRVFAIVTIWAMAAMSMMIIKTRNRVAETEWITQGQNLLAAKLRGELTGVAVGNKILGFLAEYADVTAGAVYLYDESGKVLSFAAGHAFTPESSRQTFKLGEGLLGQCAQDLKPKELQDLSQQYLTISSGLGSENPESLLIYPLLADEKLIGVIELASRSRDHRLTKLLVQQLSESLAITFRTSENRKLLNHLLTQSQNLSQELQTQQEELRVSNEELEQQAKALKESHVRLENQQAELEQNNQQLEEQSQYVEGQKVLVEEKNRALLLSQVTIQDKSIEVERASKFKSEFLANMSHELRTPLNSTLILAKLLSDDKPGTMTEEQKKYAGIIYTSGNDLLTLINDILDLSKVEAGKMEVAPEVVELESIQSSLAGTFSAQAMNKNLRFSIDIAASVPRTIVTDRQRLEQILKNFLSNAFKFTEKGTVLLHIDSHPKGISFSVTDSGIGIPSEQLGLVFEAFRQADGTSNRKYGGTGLGLSISKEFAHLLDGEITLKSTVGKGSTFTLTIPLELQEVPGETAVDLSPQLPHLKPASPSEIPAAAVKFSFLDDRENLGKFTRKILIIEDDEVFAKILYDLAHEMSFSALVAPTAEQGLSLAYQHNPHAVLLDMRLPDHNGLVVLDQMKMNPKTRHIPVHVISSSDFSKSAMEMGAIGYLNKPVNREQIMNALMNLTSHMSQSEKFVLVVEDDEVQRDHIASLISDSLITVDAVSTAGEALSKLAEKTYDCMIMDLSLPDLSGYELLSKLSNENQNYSFPPVIVYTARDLTREEEEKLRKYSGSIIIKGAKSPERLLSEVTLFLHRVETELPPERQKMLKDLRNREKTLEDRLILIVDDDVRNIFALTGALESYGARVVVARNGQEAIDKISATPDLDLVLMDIMMPVMDGHEAMRQLRQNKKFDKLPIIALTAKAMKDDQEKCLEAGANDYLSKPINLDKLLSLIRVWLPHQRSFIN